jgi:tetratricopeptide (TPR) repeat protein
VKLPNSRQAFSDAKIIFLSCLLLAAPSVWAAQPPADISLTDPQTAEAPLEEASLEEIPADEANASAQMGIPTITPLYIGTAQILNQLGEVIGSTMREPLSGSADTAAQFENTLIVGPPDEETYLNLVGDINRYEEMLREEEELRGAWDPTLSEELMAMGKMLQEQGDFNRALEVFTRAAHINRINYGLVSMEQIAPIESMVQAHIALNQWAEADRQQRYAFYVQSRAFEHNDPRLIPALDKLARWNVMTFKRGTEGEPLLKLLEAYRLYNAAAALVNVHFGFNDPRYVNYLKSMIKTAFRLALYGTQSEIDRVSMLNHSTGPFGFSQGEQALLSIYELYSSPGMRNLEGIELRRAQALAELGDWYMVFNRRQSGFRVYRDVYDILVEDGRDQTEQFFEQLVALPGFLVEEEGPVLTANSGRPLRQGYVDVMLDINQYGRASNVQALAVEPPDASMAGSEVVRMARAMNFRPRLGERDPIEVKEARLRFPFWY